ncbi:DUF3304 domain-containing protein [Luteimonas yindakuii]|uniref:DUF3304 domain-containing protein n=1 Tax=Luteimonas yindakuii TaxID=2565782 RepID=UPI00110787E3|nr:DUF3304 domain-containing protein [Luteimonas yindakuii]QCO67873.2 DUF3304 domain-containing protein [Luteimonas yindakuii]
MSTLEGGAYSAAWSPSIESGISTLDIVQVTAMACRPERREMPLHIGLFFDRTGNTADWLGRGSTDSQTQRYTRTEGAMTLETVVKPVMRSVVMIALLLAFLGAGGCQAQPATPPKEPMIGVAITGIDHLADHLSVQEFSVDGYNAAQAGKGGRSVCCAMVPAQWRPDMRVLVEWVEQNWRDCSYRRRQREVTVAPYEEAGRLWVHFLADDSMQLVVSNVGPGNPEYLGPDDPIPRKFPWHDWPADSHCKRQWIEVDEP